MHWELFDESEVDEALTSLHTGDAESQSETLEEKSLAAQIEQFRDKIGLTTSIELAFISDGISHIYYKASDWIAAFEELNSANTNTDDAEGLDNRDSTADPAVVKKWARELASHPKYSSCRSDDQREFLMEQLAGKDIGTLPLWPILRRAETIYLMEIKEKEEENLAAKARSLRDQGLNMNAIAKELHISRDRVSGLLAERSKTKAAR